jgi:hypothetical protein
MSYNKFIRDGERTNYPSKNKDLYTDYSELVPQSIQDAKNIKELWDRAKWFEDNKIPRIEARSRIK